MIMFATTGDDIRGDKRERSGENDPVDGCVCGLRDVCIYINVRACGWVCVCGVCVLFGPNLT